MRATTKALIRHYVDHLDLSGQVLEIGGHRLASCLIEEFPEPRFTYHDLNITASDIPNTIIADITGCADEIEDDRFDLIFSSDVFEHIDRPWLAAEEIARILKPGGIVVTHTLFSWRNHPCPIDYWRYSAECLEFLFADLTTLEKGYDLSQRRNNQAGFWESGRDSVPVDALGGWREHWSVWHVGRKGDGPQVPRFKDSEHPQAQWLRMDTQGTVTSPKLLGGPQHLPADDTTAELRALRREVADLRRDLTVLAPWRAGRRALGATRRAVGRVTG
ncbi:methyltransferase domain-containing protein [Aeromicrobium sp. CTD01-1L150]|uniref:methyltransferase domain-containing protein n=1 Tax=Aeromicrobium sp. CTD01-1L150 TaxID=3341830 RepID=UPI0035C0764F